MRYHEKKHARKIFGDWLQSLTPQDRKSLATMLGELNTIWLKDVIGVRIFHLSAKQRKNEIET